MSSFGMRRRRPHRPAKEVQSECLLAELESIVVANPKQFIKVLGALQRLWHFLGRLPLK
jgi:hypothetical protein